jgi:type IV pilus assembly protein PilF
MQRGQLDVAKQELDKAYLLVPDNSQVNNMMACCNGGLNNPIRPSAFRKAVAAEPPDPEAWNNYGVFLCERGKIDAANLVSEGDYQSVLPDARRGQPERRRLPDEKTERRPSPKNISARLCAPIRLPGALYQMAKSAWTAGRRCRRAGS